MATATGKKAARAAVTAALRALKPSDVVSQSAAVLSHLKSIKEYRQAKNASIYLPLDGDLEVSGNPTL